MICPIRFHDLSWAGDKPLPADEEPNMELVRQMGMSELLSGEHYNPMLAYLHSTTARMVFSVGITNKFQDKGIIGISAAPGGRWPPYLGITRWLKEYGD